MKFDAPKYDSVNYRYEKVAGPPKPHFIGEGDYEGKMPDKIVHESVGLGCSIGALTGFPQDGSSYGMEDMSKEKLDKLCIFTYAKGCIAALTDKQTKAQEKLKEAGWELLGTCVGGHPTSGGSSAKKMFLWGRGFDLPGKTTEIITKTIDQNPELVEKIRGLEREVGLMKEAEKARKDRILARRSSRLKKVVKKKAA